MTRTDAIVGSLINVFFHEVTHALFDILQIPVLGPEEEAADTVSAILMLLISKEEARRMIIAGAAYIYKDDLKSDVTLQLADFSDSHSTPQQRFFNLLCIAYGVNQEMFSELVKKRVSAGRPRGRMRK